MIRGKFLEVTNKVEELTGYTRDELVGKNLFETKLVPNKYKKLIEDTLDCEVETGQIAKLNIVGSVAIASNKGCLCHPKVTDKERQQMEKLFDVNVMIGTVNHGVPMVGSGLVANTKGAIIGNQTTGIEMGRIEEALGFLD